MKKPFSLLFFMTTLILSSCSGSVVTPVTPSTVSPVLISTLKAFATPISVMDYPGPVSDGKLLFSIEPMVRGCQHLRDPIEIKLIFNNLTDQTIDLIKEFSIAGSRYGAGNLTPFLTTSTGEDVYSYADVSMFDTAGIPVDDYVPILANQSFTRIVNYRFPLLLVESITSETITYQTPTPGKYHLRFVYLQYERNTPTWHGVISSNQIDICITD